MLGVEYKTHVRKSPSVIGEQLEVTEMVYHEWRCMLCDTQNEFDDFFCCFCSNGRDTQMWRCFCNMANESKHSTCEACGAER